MGTAMLEKLPIELLVNIVSCLNLEDCISLICTSSVLRAILKDEGVCQIITKHNIKHSLESQQASRRDISYAKAVTRAFSRKQAIALGRPHSVVTLGYGISFFYNEGMLCYRSGRQIRILNTLEPWSAETVIDAEVIHDIAMKAEDYGGSSSFAVEILYFRDHLLTLRFSHEAGNTPFVIAIEMRNPGRASRLPNPNTRNLVVRNDSCHIVLATYTGMASANQFRHEWVVRYSERTYGLVPTPRVMAQIQLKNFFGTDIGQTVAFEIIDGYFYAVSNQSTYEVEEIDWTSYYHCYRFPLGTEDHGKLQHKRIWRRQHREGPINDCWTSVSIHKDEKTGVVTIVEARREWIGGTSTQTRTFYFELLTFDDEEEECNCQRLGTLASSSDAFIPNATTFTSLDVDRVLLKTLTKGDCPNYEEVRRTLRGLGLEDLTWTLKPRHINYYACLKRMILSNLPPTRIPSAFHTEPPASSAMMLSSYKYRTYIPSASASLDIINAPNSRRDSPLPTLRISSRYRVSPLSPTTNLLNPPIVDPKKKKAVPDSEVTYRNRKTVLWPPANSSPLLYEMLCPYHPDTLTTRSHPVNPLTAVADERSVVFMGGKHHDGLGQVITLINFDKDIRFTGSSSSDGCWRVGNDEPVESRLEALRRRMENWRIGKRREKEREEAEGARRSWMRTEEAWWRGCGVEYIV